MFGELKEGEPKHDCPKVGFNDLKKIHFDHTKWEAEATNGTFWKWNCKEGIKLANSITYLKQARKKKAQERDRTQLTFSRWLYCFYWFYGLIFNTNAAQTTCLLVKCMKFSEYQGAALGHRGMVEECWDWLEFEEWSPHFLHCCWCLCNYYNSDCLSPGS